MIKLFRTDSAHPDFKALVKYLDAYLAEVDGEEHAFYNQYNKIDHLKQVVIAYENEQPIGCGAIRPYSPTLMEVKRMYTSPNGRKKGVATQVLKELEKWTTELGFTKCILETGKKQTEAIALYEKNGYDRIPNYGQYLDVANSVCFEKALIWS